MESKNKRNVSTAQASIDFFPGNREARGERLIQGDAESFPCGKLRALN
jgi:hypothetical protein